MCRYIHTCTSCTWTIVHTCTLYFLLPCTFTFTLAHSMLSFPFLHTHTCILRSLPSLAHSLAHSTHSPHSLHTHVCLASTLSAWGSCSFTYASRPMRLPAPLMLTWHWAPSNGCIPILSLLFSGSPCSGSSGSPGDAAVGKGHHSTATLYPCPPEVPVTLPPLLGTTGHAEGCAWFRCAGL